MGCSCLKSNVVIKSNVNSLNPNSSNLDIPNSNANNQNNLLSNNNEHLEENNNNNNADNNNVRNVNLRELRNSESNLENRNSNEISNNNNRQDILNLNSNNSNNNNMNAINLINRNISNNINNALFSQFQSFEPFLQSRTDQDFNYPELQDEYIGHGLKRMKGYISHITLEKLQKVREDFWTSRIEGNQEIWELLRVICSDQSLSQEDIEGMMKAGGIVPYRDCINVVYDDKGAIYEIPNYCINDPSQYNIPEIEYNKEIPKEIQIKIIIRNFADQFDFFISNHKTIADVKNNIKKIKKEKNDKKFKKIEIEKIRLFFCGKELLNDKQVWFYNIENESIIQMLIPNFSKESIISIQNSNEDNKEKEKDNNFDNSNKDLGEIVLRKSTSSFSNKNLRKNNLINVTNDDINNNNKKENWEHLNLMDKKETNNKEFFAKYKEIGKSEIK